MRAANYKETLINFLKENILAAENCLTIKIGDRSGYQKDDVLGFPAAILILSVIDAIGTIKCGKGKTFQVLNTSLFDCKEITTIVATDLYQGYRNPFLHNNILLSGRFLTKGDGTKPPFVIKNNKVINIDLASLLSLSQVALKKFEASVTEQEIIKNIQLEEHIERHSLDTNIAELFSEISKVTPSSNNFSTSSISSVLAQVGTLENTLVSGTVIPKNILNNDISTNFD